MKFEQQNAAGLNSGTSVKATQGAALNSAAGQYRAAASGTNGDQAEISGLSRAIQTFQNDRSARVDQLTALVRSGKYEVSPALISKGIVNEALSSGSQSGAVAS